MRALNGQRLDLVDDKIVESVISKECTLNYFNLSALKNIFIQDMRIKKSDSSGFITGAVIGGLIDNSVGDDSIVDGAIVGGLLLSSTEDYVEGNIYATLQFFDGKILSVKFDNDSELAVLQDYAIKNHSIKSSSNEESSGVFQFDKKLIERGELYTIITLVLMVITFITFLTQLISKTIFISAMIAGLCFCIFQFISAQQHFKKFKKI